LFSQTCIGCHVAGGNIIQPVSIIPFGMIYLALCSSKLKLTFYVFLIPLHFFLTGVNSIHKGFTKVTESTKSIKRGNLNFEIFFSFRSCVDGVSTIHMKNALA